MDRATYGKSSLIWPKTFGAPLMPESMRPPVTTNKPVNRIFQSSCGVLLSEGTLCQKEAESRKKKKSEKDAAVNPALRLNRRLLQMQWKIVMIPVVVAEVRADQQCGLC